MNKIDVILVGQIAGSQTGGFSGNEYNAPTYLQTLAPTYLRNHFYKTFCAEPVFFLQLATELRKFNLSVKIIDGLLDNHNKESLKKELQNWDAKIYAFSIYHSSYFAVIEIIHSLKEFKPEAKIIIGGTYASLVYNQLLSRHYEIDYVIVGDGDVALPQFCQNIISGKNILEIKGLAYRNNDKIVLNPPEPVDINEIGFLARDFAKEIIKNNFSFSMVSSRGCGYGACSFCYLPTYQKNSNLPKFRGRNPQLVIDEIKYLQEKYSIERVTFVDEDYFGSFIEGTKRAIEFAELLIKENIKIDYYVNCRINSVLYLIKNDLLKILAESGLKYFFIGIESGSDRVLKKYKKGITVEQIKNAARILKNYGIKINPGLITFDPDLTIDDVKANIEIVKEIDYYDIFVFTRKLVILPGIQVGNSDCHWDLPNQNDPFQLSKINPYDYFLDKKTALLYIGLVKFRDLLYPIYRFLCEKYLEEGIREILIKSHFKFFDNLYKYINDSLLLNDIDVEKFVIHEIKLCNNLIESQLNIS